MAPLWAGSAARQISAGGRIIAFSSSVIAKAFLTYGPYIASKAGAEGLVRVLANELRGRNVTVNAVAPGPVATELFLTGKAEAQVEELRKLPCWNASASLKTSPILCRSLLGPGGGWVNGQVLRAMAALRSAFQGERKHKSWGAFLFFYYYRWNHTCPHSLP